MSQSLFVEEQIMDNVVSEDTNAGLAAEVTLPELHTATLSLQNGRTSGIDGLSMEFYKSFWDVIGAKVNWGKSKALMAEGELGEGLTLPGGLQWKSGGLR
ncbi:unnamed protein product [Tetraodon nigroviridis]|uniref:(spotted green pufferfish) hypothetical protein n=1 Tax=Tetraodon nigroviridis TaxID=99883 RepID=Q4SYJ1_TETNG|nr:unnamed protein product [Tetraodon nigroviridis]